MLNNITLTDNVVTLRPFQTADVEPFHLAARESLAELIPWMTWARPDYGLKEVGEYVRTVRSCWEAGTFYAFAVTDARDGSMLGAASLSHIHPVYHFCNLGYWVRTSRRGQGLAARATRLAAKFGLEQLSLLRVELVIAVGNQASLKVAEKSGARREGILRDRVTVREKVYDGVMFSFVRADFDSH